MCVGSGQKINQNKSPASGHVTSLIDLKAQYTYAYCTCSRLKAYTLTGSGSSLAVYCSIDACVFVWWWDGGLVISSFWSQIYR